MPSTLAELLPAQSLASNILLQIVLATALLGLLIKGLFSLRVQLRTLLERQSNLVDRINGQLPQTQCGRCGHAGCLPYAKAISQGEPINKCPPGGVETIAGLAQLLGRSVRPLDPAHGEPQPLQVAVIREDECIGCLKCIRACPVDAILGGPKLMHTVIESECTGCDLCIEPCPVDCIDLIPTPGQTPKHWPLPERLPSPRNQLIALQEVQE